MAQETENILYHAAGARQSTPAAGFLAPTKEKTMTAYGIEKLLGAPAGTVVTVKPDWIVVNGGPSYIAAQEAKNVADPARVQVYFDHHVPAGAPEDSHVFDIIRDFAQKFGCQFLQAKGIAYQYMLDQVIKPGEIILGGGRHGSLFGSKGALGINVSPLELARVLESGTYQFIVPQTLVVKVKGTLPKDVSMLDGALKFLTENSDISGKMIQFITNGLTPHQKSVLCSMACETGAFSALCVEAGVPDRVLDLAGTVPMTVFPCNTREEQGRAKKAPVTQLKGLQVQAGQIGGYTGGTIEDLRTAVQMIQGKKLALGFRLSICPATSEDYLKAAREGILEKFIDYGAQIAPAGDHSVVRQGAGVIGKNETLVTTGLYTFDGCMGVKESAVYMASLETVIRASFEKAL